MDRHDASEGAAPSADVGTATARARLSSDQTVSDADQTVSDAEQTASDEDQGASDVDQGLASSDQLLSDRDQAASDLDMEGRTDAAAESEHERSRAEREQVSLARRVTHADRQRTADGRETTARGRDAIASQRDQQARERDALAAELEASIAAIDTTLAERFRQLREQAAADRAEAARDRNRAARERAEAARERERLEAELQAAHLDDLTGAYRREMGRLAVSHELDRARRGDGRFVLAFVDVDDLKVINDRDGHAAGDRALQAVVDTMRHSLRSYDPIFRYGGDEFVAGMSGTDLDDAKQRFDTIQATLAREAGISISVGLAALSGAESADELTQQADQALTKRKGVRRHERNALDTTTKSDS
jgi:diguanylate cyclase (GGDEF)-like protein